MSTTNIKNTSTKILVRRFNPDELALSYNALCNHLYPWDGVVNTPFGAAQCLVEPLQVTDIHNHHEGETFFIMEGEGEITVDGESTPIAAGDVVYFVPFTSHAIRNTSPTQNLLLLTIYWEDMNLSAGIAQKKAQQPIITSKRVWVAPPPVTPNGDLHLGHLSGPYIAADVYVRSLKMQGVEAYYTSGGHDSEGYVLTTAEKLGMTGKELADKASKEVRQTMQKANIHVDYFWRPDKSEEYVKFVHDFFLKLYNKGFIVKKETPSLYCPSCDKLLFQSYIQGECPQCGDESQANSCENCGRSNNHDELKNVHCATCGTKPIERPLEKLYFQVKPFEKQLRAYYRTVKMAPRLHAICEQAILDGLIERPISQVTDWGMTIPLEGFENQRLETWFELAPGQCFYGVGKMAEQAGLDGNWESFWKSPEADVVQFFGFDNGYFYALLFPAIYLAYDADIQLPKVFVNNEFYHLEGSKFSTSRRHVIWGADILKEYSSDVVRFYVSYTRPETDNTNFSKSEFKATLEQELNQQWNQWINEVSERLERQYQGVVPYPGAWSDFHQTFYKDLNNLTKTIKIAYQAETFSPQKVSHSLCEWVRLARRFGKAEAFLATVNSKKDETRTAMALELMAVKQFALLIAPIMPNFGERLWKSLGFQESIFNNTWKSELEFVAGGTKINALPKVVFTADV